MVVHDVEDLTGGSGGSESSYGEGTMLVQRVSSPPGRESPQPGNADTPPSPPLFPTWAVRASLSKRLPLLGLQLQLSPFYLMSLGSGTSPPFPQTSKASAPS